MQSGLLRTILVLCAGLVLLPAAPSVSQAQSSAEVAAETPAQAWTRYRRDVLPELRTRRDKADQRTEDARRFFAGELPLDEAFPQLAFVPLEVRGSVEGRMALLDEVAAQRALERADPLPDFGASSRTSTVRKALEAALDAEEQADGLERRVLIGYRALLREHPSLGAAAVGADLAELDSEIARARNALEADPEDRGAVELTLGRLEEDRAAYSGLVRDLRWSVLAGATPTVDLAPHLAALTDPVRSASAARRLRLLRRWADEAGKATIDQALVNRLTEVELVQAREELARAEAEVDSARAEEGLALSADELAELTVELDARTAELERVGDAVASAPEGEPGSLEAARFELLLVRRKIAQRRVEATEARLMASEEKQIAAVEAKQEAQKAREAEERALREAEEAEEAAQDAVGRQIAKYKKELAQLQSRAGDAWTITEDAASASALLQQTRTEDLAKVEEALELALAKEGPGRAKEATDLHRELRRFITQLRAAAVEAEGRLTDVRTDRSAALAEREDASAVIEAAAKFAAGVTGNAAASLTEAIDAARAAGEAESEALDTRVTGAEEYVRVTLGQLADAKRMRAQLRPFVPRKVLLEDRAYVLRDLQLELTLVGPNLVNGARRRLAGITLAVTQDGVLARVWTFVLATFWVLFAVFAWVFLRRRAELISQGLLDRLASRTSRLYRSALTSIASEATPTVRATIDLVAALLLARALRESLPEVALILFTAAQFSLYRALVGGFGLAVVKRPSIRPALASLSAEAHAVALAAARAVAFWWVTRSFVGFMTGELLRTDALRQVLTLVLDVGFLLAVIVLLHRVEPITRALLASRAGADSPLMRPLLAELKGRAYVIRWLRGAVGATLLTASALTGFITNLASEGSLLGRALNRVARYRMTRDANNTVEVLRPVSPALIETLVTEDCPPDMRVGRPTLDAGLEAAIAGWQMDGSRGIVALVGNRGDGERTWLDSAQTRLEAEGRTVRRVALQGRYVDSGELFEALARGFDIPASRDVETLAAAIQELPEGIFILEEAQWAFLRAVHGLSALRSLLDLLSRTSERHFWILSLHRPAWQYLSRLGELLKFDMFRLVLEVPPMGEAQLREMISARVSAAGWSLDFARLARPTPLAGDQALEVERAETAFYRLLAESSEGNPAAALRQFVGCLHVVEEGMLEVRVGESLGVTGVDGLDSTDLFILAALQIHDCLSRAELGRVNNLSAGLVRAGVQNLMSRGIIEETPQGVRVSRRWVPSVARTLRRRHFLHWSE